MIRIDRTVLALQKNGIYILSGGFILFLIIFTIFYQNEKTSIQKQGSITICKVYYSAWLVGQGQYFCKYIYYADGKKYYGQEVHYYSKCYIGEFYKIKYLPKKPNISKIDFNEKVLSKNMNKYFPLGQNPFEAEIKQDSTKRLRGN